MRKKLDTTQQKITAGENFWVDYTLCMRGSGPTALLNLVTRMEAILFYCITGNISGNLNLANWQLGTKLPN